MKRGGEVAASDAHLVLEQLGGHIVGRPDHGLGHLERALEYLGDPEVPELDAPGVVHQDVCALEIEVEYGGAP